MPNVKELPKPPTKAKSKVTQDSQSVTALHPHLLRTMAVLDGVCSNLNRLRFTSRPSLPYTLQELFDHFGSLPESPPEDDLEDLSLDPNIPASPSNDALEDLPIGADIQVLKTIGKGNFGITQLCRDKKYPDNHTNPLPISSLSCSEQTFVFTLHKESSERMETEVVTVPSKHLFIRKLVRAKNRAKEEAEGRVWIDPLIERNILRQIAHPNIVYYRDAYRLQGYDVISLEYVDGGSLQDRIAHHNQTGTRLTETKILSIFVQICMALDYLHENNIMHRDLKPGNVLITKRRIVKLCDFGLSIQHEKEVHKPGISNTVLGTPYYMAPEVTQGCYYGPTADVWSLGVLLYYIVTLRKPFEGKDTREVAESINNNTPDQSLIPNTFHPLFKQLLFEGLLKKNPSERPTIREVLQTEYMTYWRNKNIESYAAVVHKFGNPLDQTALRILVEQNKRIDASLSSPPFTEKLHKERQISVERRVNASILSMFKKPGHVAPPPTEVDANAALPAQARKS